MNSNPLVSICVPVYNVEMYIGRCARSIFEQDYPLMEVVFIDDCSSDGSLSVLKSVIACYPGMKGKVIILHNESNQGVAAVRNSLLSEATGEMIMFVDADDWLEKDAVVTLMKKRQETNADIVSGNALRHTTEGEDLLLEPQYSDGYDMAMQMLEMNINHTLWRRLIRRSLFVEHDIHCMDGFNYGEDLLLMTQVAYYAKSCAHTDKVVYHYNCQNKASYMMRRKRHTFDIESYQSNVAVQKALEGFLENKNPALQRKLKAVRREHLDYQCYMALRYGTWQDYRMVCREMNNRLLLPFCCIRHIVRELHWHRAGCGISQVTSSGNTLHISR